MMRQGRLLIKWRVSWIWAIPADQSLTDWRLRGVNEEIRFPQAPLTGTYDFSFSGTKTAVLYYTQKNKGRPDYSRAQGGLRVSGERCRCFGEEIA